MQFIVIGRDGTDEGAMDRRLAVRDAHIKTLDHLRSQGKVIIGAVLVDDNDKMIGSNVLYDVESREELDALLAVEPYVTGEVWKSIDIQKAKLGPSFADLAKR